MQIKKLVFLFPVFFFLVLGVSTAFAATQNVTLQNVKGPVEVIPSGATEGSVGMDGTTLKEGDTVKTYDNSSAEIVFEGVGVIYVKPSSHLTLNKAQKNGAVTETMTTLKVGEIKAKVDKLLASGSKFETQTPMAVAAVRGTTYIVRVTQNGVTTVHTVDGIVNLRNLLGGLGIDVGEGFTATIDENGSISQPIQGGFVEVEKVEEDNGGEEGGNEADDLLNDTFDQTDVSGTVIEGQSDVPSPSS